MSRMANPGSAQGGTVVVRLWGWVVGGFLLIAASVTAYLTARGHSDSAARSTELGAGVFVFIGTLFSARFKYEIKAGRLTTRERLDRTQTVDLDKLTKVIGPDKPKKPWFLPLGARRFLLELHDRDGSKIKLTFNATTTDQRRRLLAALEPYIMADGVARTGCLPNPEARSAATAVR